MINSYKHDNEMYVLKNGEIFINDNKKAANPRIIPECVYKYFLSQASQLKGKSKSCDYIQAINLAINDIFFTGVIMSYFNSDLIYAIKNVDPKIEINIIVSDTDNNEIVNILNPLYGKLNNNWSAHKEISNKNKKKFNDNPNVNFQYINRYSPISFFAIDIEKETDVSFIQAKLHSIPMCEKSEFGGNFYQIIQSGTKIDLFYNLKI